MIFLSIEEEWELIKIMNNTAFFKKITGTKKMLMIGPARKLIYPIVMI